MQKSKSKMIIVIISIVVTLIITGFIIWNHTPLIKGIIATNVYGNNTCTGFHSQKNSFPDAGLTIWRCPVCNRAEEVSVTESHFKKICYDCARLTNRCSVCANRLSNGK